MSDIRRAVMILLVSSSLSLLTFFAFFDLSNAFEAFGYAGTRDVVVTQVLARRVAGNGVVRRGTY